MPSPSRKADWPIIAALVLAVVAVALGVYAWGYFALSTVEVRVKLHAAPLADEEVYDRVFNRQWQVSIYTPAAHVESAIRGKRVTARQKLFSFFMSGER